MNLWLLNIKHITQEYNIDIIKCIGTFYLELFSYLKLKIMSSIQRLLLAGDAFHISTVIYIYVNIAKCKFHMQLYPIQKWLGEELSNESLL